MPLPKFAAPAMPPTRPSRLSRTQAAGRLGLHPAGVDKLVHAGVLRPPIPAGEVAALAARQYLKVIEGELTVLRTDARADAYPGEDRRYIGFHTEHSDDQLAETSLRWWRSDPVRVLDNELFAVTVATFPVAVYRIVECLGSKIREDEAKTRHHYEGQLLARVHPGMSATFPANTRGDLRGLAKQIMSSRIVVTSGGPIGYLAADLATPAPNS